MPSNCAAGPTPHKSGSRLPPACRERRRRTSMSPHLSPSASAMSPLFRPAARRPRTLHGASSIKSALLLAFLTTSCSAASCQGPSGTVRASAAMHMPASLPKLTDYVTWEREIIFRNHLASGSLEVFFDRRGGFVVADRDQNQVRVYSSTARLLWSVGGTGPGPEEFQRLRTAVRTSSKQVIAVDNAGKLSVFDSAGTLKHTARTGLNPLYNALLLDDHTLLLSGRPEGASDTPLLHVWNLSTNAIERSFFRTPPHPPAYDEAYRFTGWADAAIRGDTLAVIFPLADTVYLFRRDGSMLQRLPLRLEYFRRLREPAPRNGSPEAQLQWRQSYTRLSTIFWAPDGSLYVQYFNLSEHLPVWGLARFRLADNQTALLFDVPEALPFLGISPRDSRLYFIKADELESTSWSIARLNH